MNFKFFQDSSGKYLISCGDQIVDLKHFLIQTAAAVIIACQQYPTEEDKKPSKGIGKIIADNCNFAAHGYVNVLLTQVQFLFSFVENAVEFDRLYFIFDQETREIITKALISFQSWKTEYTNKQKEKYGAHYGSETGFFKMDWTKHNKDFLSLESAVYVRK